MLLCGRGRSERSLGLDLDTSEFRTTLSSPDFADGRMLPLQPTCDGKYVSPTLAWSGVPEGTRSLVLICDDSDAPKGTSIEPR